MLVPGKGRPVGEPKGIDDTVDSNLVAEDIPFQGALPPADQGFGDAMTAIDGADLIRHLDVGEKMIEGRRHAGGCRL